MPRGRLARARERLRQRLAHVFLLPLGPVFPSTHPDSECVQDLVGLVQDCDAIRIAGSPDFEAAHPKRCDRVEQLIPQFGGRTRKLSSGRSPFPLGNELLQLVNQSFQQRGRNPVILRWQIPLGHKPLEKCDRSCAPYDEDHRPELIDRKDRRGSGPWRAEAVCSDSYRSSCSTVVHRPDRQDTPPTRWHTSKRALRNARRTVLITRYDSPACQGRSRHRVPIEARQ
jgi:hypothetical protein